MLNHWCHGAPGAIGPLLAATQLYLQLSMTQDCEINQVMAQRLYRAAMKAAEMTWQQGLVLKGNCLCHGISGNGLLLHTVARWHKAQESHQQEFEQKLGQEAGTFAKAINLYQIRALMFARAMSLESVQRPCEEHQDRGRLKVGEADHPWSLMEGLPGEICMLAELTHPDDLAFARFPAYDVLF